MLRVDALKLKDGPLRVELHEPVSELELGNDPDFEFTGHMSGSLVFTRIREEVLARGNVSLSVRCQCVRCLQPIEFTVETPIALVYMHDPTLLDPHQEVDRDDDVVYFDGITIEPLKDMRDLILLELPPYPSCDLDPTRHCEHEELKRGPVTFGPADPSEDSPIAGGGSEEPNGEWRAALRRLSPPSKAEEPGS